MFHVSFTDLGPTVMLEPRHPQTAGPNEPRIKRVCFASSIKNCLIAIMGQEPDTVMGLLREIVPPWNERIENPTVYVTNCKLKLPPDVSDYRLTGERWALKPVLCQRLGYIDLAKVMFGQVREIPLTARHWSRTDEQQHKLWRQVAEYNRSLSLLK